jgi:hypothetical protein
MPDKEMLGLNIVEFAGDDAALIDNQVTTLCQRLDELIAASEAGVIGWQVCTIWTALSASTRCVKAVGLLGNAKGAADSLCRRYLRAAGASGRLYRRVSRCSTATA